MQGQRIGYVRVSSFDQNPERQLEGVQVARVFTDKASGKDTQRPELERLLAFVREGDTVVVHSCWVPYDHWPIRSWPLYRARQVMREVLSNTEPRSTT